MRKRKLIYVNFSLFFSMFLMLINVSSFSLIYSTLLFHFNKQIPKFEQRLHGIGDSEPQSATVEIFTLKTIINGVTLFK